MIWIPVLTLAYLQGLNVLAYGLGVSALSMIGRSEPVFATLRGLKPGRAAAFFPLCNSGSVIFITQAQETLECGDGEVSRTQPHRRPLQKRLG